MARGAGTARRKARYEAAVFAARSVWRAITPKRRARDRTSLGGRVVDFVLSPDMLGLLTIAALIGGYLLYHHG